MIRLLLLALATGCGFTASDDDPADGVPAAACDPDDETLKLCIDFEAPFVDVILDGSGDGTQALAGAVGTMERGNERAAVLSIASTMHVGETPKLDIAQHLSLDLWIRPIMKPGPGKKYWMVDNATQYAASFTDMRKARCWIDNQTLDSDPLPMDDRWHHVGCTYDGTTMKVYVDGQLAKCSPQTIAIPIDGAAGLAIGAKLGGTTLAPMYTERYVGGLDNVRVWARSDVDMCAAAGASGCAATCP